MDLARLADLVSEKTGFDEKALSERRLHALAQSLEQQGLSVEDLDQFPRLEEMASEIISVGETYFYRQIEHFELILRHAADWALDRKPVLAWSAGCSTGEEAWSIAAVLTAALGEGYALEVLGTDMSEKSLQTAREGIYGKWSLRREGAGMPMVLQGGGPERMEVLPHLRAVTRFQRHNLLDAAPFPGRKARLIFCRNVLIYLSPQAARRVTAHLAEALEEDGLLVLGSVDIDFTPPGLVPEEPRVLQAFRKPRISEAPAAKPQRPLAEDGPSKPYDAQAAHLKALELAEAGGEAEALQKLLELRVMAPGYLPGLFDLGMALSRKGAKREAAASMESLLDAARERDLTEVLDAPEPVSLSFYVTSAQTFLERYGKNP
jgi:chemotaxis protein methyltransferase CheR